MKRIFLKLLISCLALVFSIGVLEGILRLAERRLIEKIQQDNTYCNVARSDIPGLYYTLLPGHREGEIVFNSHGFNMPERPAEKPTGTRRLFVIGDSVAQGVGITRTDEAMPVVLEQLLRARGIPDSVEVWNAGTGGYNAEQIRIQLMEILPTFSPDGILYIFNFNDYWEPNRYFHGQPAAPPSENVRQGFLDWLKSFRIVIRGRDAWNTFVSRLRGYPPVYVDYKIDYPFWHAMKSTIQRMYEHCGSRNLPFAVAIHPYQAFLFRRDDRNRALQDIRRFLQEAGIPHLDLTPCYQPHYREKIYLLDGNHMTSAGYRLMAECVADWIVTEAAPFEFLRPSAWTHQNAMAGF